MLAFHNDKAIQEKYLKRIHDHAKADEIIKGQYWENGKGCAVGCTIHDSDHRKYETELGIPMWMARVEDRLFEGMSNERAQKWPIEFLEAINIGADLSKLLIPFLIFIVESAREKTKNEKYLNAIDGVLVELKKETLDLPALRKARSDAAADAAADAYAAAAYAADAAAAAAAADADAADAAADAYADAADAAADAYAYAAAAAAYAAAAAAYAADAAAGARKNEYEKFADKLLELIRGCNPEASQKGAE